jgi:hypothetical protein
MDKSRYSYSMELTAILKELRDERDLVEQAIISIGHLAAGQGRRRGRPPGWMKQMEEATKSKQGKSPKSKETQ